jgi:hypothetical protein
MERYSDNESRTLDAPDPARELNVIHPLVERPPKRVVRIVNLDFATNIFANRRRSFYCFLQPDGR